MTLQTHKRVGLYIHIPWCVKKCPYCDFNSHVVPKQFRQAQLQTGPGMTPVKVQASANPNNSSAVTGSASTSKPVISAIPLDLQETYVAALLHDLATELAWLGYQPVVSSIFFGGGTPSLLSPYLIGQILETITQHCHLEATAEITLEANPGTLELDTAMAGSMLKYLTELRATGVNRLSIGVQSFNPQMLKRLGRVHTQYEAQQAYQAARQAGFERINLDLMYGLPGQSQADMLADIKQALTLDPDHLSYYQLTLEENTPFFFKPPSLPDDDHLYEWQTHALNLIQAAGYQRYEISAFAKKLCQQSQHNLNYWRFGDYLGIGAGAHGKVQRADGLIQRRIKPSAPNAYQQVFQQTQSALVSPGLEIQTLTTNQVVFEFMLNQLRLFEPVSLAHFVACTGQAVTVIEPVLDQARQHGLIERDEQQESFRVTPRGHDYLNTWLTWFE